MRTQRRVITTAKKKNVMMIPILVMNVKMTAVQVVAGKIVKGRLIAFLDEGGRVTIHDTPFFYDAAIGPDFTFNMAYAPSGKLTVNGANAGYNWAASYLSVELRKISATKFRYYFGNGARSWNLTAAARTGQEVAASGDHAQVGTQGRPAKGRSFALYGDYAVLTKLDGTHFVFYNYQNDDYRLAWIADKAGQRLTFEYAGATSGVITAAVTADNRKFNFEYHSGFSGGLRRD